MKHQDAEHIENITQTKGHILQVLRVLDGLDARTALRILAEVSMTILALPDSDTMNNARLPPPRILVRKRGSISRVAQDSELRSFIHSIDREITLVELRKMLVSEFGEDRVPSRSSLHRYIQKVQRSAES
jgi:hypothetical protein